MAVLSRERICDLNFSMLGKGAPVVYDGMGYNKIDFGKMDLLSEKEELSIKDILAILKSLNRYKNTQLSEYASDIAESIEFYTKEDKPKIQVLGKTQDGLVKLYWGYDSKIYKLMKSGEVDKNNFRWTKDEKDTWILNVKFSYLKDFGKIFSEKGNADVTEINNFLKKCCKEKEEKIEILPSIEVSRSSTDFDRISVKFPFYNKEVVTVAKSLNGKWNNRKKAWEIFIEDSKKFYDAIPSSVFDKSPLKSWADLVSSWGKGDIQLKDLSQFDLPFKPYDFQPEDAKKLLKMEAGLNGNEVGCGKTFEQIIIGESIPMKKIGNLSCNIKIKLEERNPFN